jgi:hypothetical protein
MLCTTTKKGIECFFMSKKGCSFLGGKCHEIVPQCEGCGHILVCDSQKYCKACPDPAAKWQFGPCNLATHVQRKLVTDVKKVNPLKASKKAALGKG